MRTRKNIKFIFLFRLLSLMNEILERDGFRDGLIAGRVETVHPILYWLLRRKEDLKKRAYLSRFLVKVDIAPEMRSDSDVMDLYEQVPLKCLIPKVSIDKPKSPSTSN